jgi:hypothetical protein
VSITIPLVIAAFTSVILNKNEATELRVQNDNVKVSTQKIEVWAQDIQGIIYYLDKNMNVYSTEDIVSNKSNPKIIAKYTKSCEIYHIPEFNI